MATAKLIVPGLHEVQLDFVNAFILEAGDGLALIDTGLGEHADAIVDVIRGIGRDPGEVRDILVTHCHIDHAGGLARLKQLTGATASMHPVDAEMVRRGESLRPLVAGPGLVNAVLSRVLARKSFPPLEAAEVEREVADGDVLPIAGGLRAIHVPGHSAGQLAFLWGEHGGVLIAADAAANALGLATSPIYEDVAEGLRSLEKLSSLDFEVACFGHGKPIRSGASRRFRRKWGRSGTVSAAA